MQVHGGMGFVEETGAAQYLRDARITTIYEGTTGIQANDLVGRKVAFEKGATAFAVIAEMRALDPMLDDAGRRVTTARAATSTSAIDALEAATRWVVETFAEDPEAAAAVAVPYLKLFGHRRRRLGHGARRASSRSASSRIRESDRDFLSAKLVTARFYGEHVLPQARAHADTVVTARRACSRSTKTQF